MRKFGPDHFADIHFVRSFIFVLFCYGSFRGCGTGEGWIILYLSPVCINISSCTYLCIPCVCSWHPGASPFVVKYVSCRRNMRRGPFRGHIWLLPSLAVVRGRQDQGRHVLYIVDATCRNSHEGCGACMPLPLVVPGKRRMWLDTVLCCCYLRVHGVRVRFIGLGYHLEHRVRWRVH